MNGSLESGPSAALIVSRGEMADGNRSAATRAAFRFNVNLLLAFHIELGDSAPHRK